MKILYEYFKLYPDEYFYTEEEWFYDKNDIERIYFENPYDNKWCYNNPKEKSLARLNALCKSLI